MFEIPVFIVSPFVALMLVFWFKTDFVLEYGKILGLRKPLAIDSYEKALEFNPKLTYQLFVATNYNRFLHRLVNCTVCLATWLSILSTSAISAVFGQYLLLCTIPLSTVLGIVAYLTIKRLL
jgi:hypothetical protein